MPDIDYERRTQRLNKLDNLLGCKEIAQVQVGMANRNFSNGAGRDSVFTWRSPLLSREDIKFLKEFESKRGIADAITVLVKRHLGYTYTRVFVSSYRMKLPWLFHRSLVFDVEVHIQG